MDSTTSGFVDAAFRSVIDEIDAEGAFLDDDIQIAAYVGDELVLDLAAGPEITPDSLLIPYSVSKNAIGMTVGLLIERGLLDLDARVAQYWPEFAAAGKDAVTVRQLLSHQAGLPQTVPPLDLAQMSDTLTAAEMFAAQRPLWWPGAAFGYHAASIGVLASELVRRITSVTLAEFFEREIRAPLSLDFYLGLPEELEARTLDLIPGAPMGAGGEVPLQRLPGQLGRYTFGAIGGAAAGDDERRAAARRDRATGMPAVHATVNARGIAGLFAEAVVGLSSPPMLSAETVEQVSQTQVVGVDQVIGIERRYGIVFQKPAPALVFGGFRAFGHDGAGGALGFHDPESALSFGYTIRRTPPPGGADARALRIAMAMRSIVLGA